MMHYLSCVLNKRVVECLLVLYFCMVYSFLNRSPQKSHFGDLFKLARYIWLLLLKYPLFKITKTWFLRQSSKILDYAFYSYFIIIHLLWIINKRIIYSFSLLFTPTNILLESPVLLAPVDQRCWNFLSFMSSARHCRVDLGGPD